MQREDLDPQFRNLVGTLLAGRYRVDAPIAAGGMSTVFAATQVGLGRRVAVKLLCPSLAVSGDYGERFEREAQSLARLDHPNCLRVLDYGVTDDGVHFLATELIEGKELRECMDEAMTPELAVRRIQQVLRGLEHAHACGVVHRDLKPENILISYDAEGEEVIKIVDFGIAKLISAPMGGCRTAAGVVFGTPQYMSPEQASGQPIDARSDLYAVGVLLFRMLAGHPPFDGRDAIAVTRAQIHDDPPPLPEWLPSALTNVVLRLLSKQPEDRYDSAAATLDALHDALSAEIRSLPATLDLPTLDVPTLDVPLAPAPASPAETRNWWAIFAAATAASFAVTLGIAAAVRWQPSTDLGPDGKLSVMTLEDADRALARGDAARAHETLSTMLDENPDDPKLLWRDGQALLAAGMSERALERFAAALSADSSLQDDPRFYAELDKLLRDPTLERQAVDLALQRLDSVADAFLLELVNRTERPLAFVDRNRVLDRLRESGRWDDVDVRGNARLDLRQAADAPEPCAAFVNGLDQLVPDMTEEDIQLIREIEVPLASEESGSAELCAEAEQTRELVISTHDALGELEGAGFGGQT